MRWRRKASRSAFVSITALSQLLFTNTLIQRKLENQENVRRSFSEWWGARPDTIQSASALPFCFHLSRLRARELGLDVHA